MCSDACESELHPCMWEWDPPIVKEWFYGPDAWKFFLLFPIFDEQWQTILCHNPDRFSSVVWLTSTDKKMSGGCLSNFYRAVRKWNDHHNVFSKAALFISGNINSCNCFWLPLNFTELLIIDILSLVELQV